MSSSWSLASFWYVYEGAPGSRPCGGVPKHAQLPLPMLTYNPRGIRNEAMADHFPTQVDDNEHPMNFAQTFHLMKDPAGSFFVSHDIFKLVY